MSEIEDEFEKTLAKQVCIKRRNELLTMFADFEVEGQPEGRERKETNEITEDKKELSN